MPSTYSTRLRLELQATGENQTTWGDKANTVFRRLEESITGVLPIALGTSVSSSYALSYANGTTDEARYACLILTGQLASAISIQLSATQKIYQVYNQTSGSPLLMGVVGKAGVTLADGWNHVVTDGSATWLANPLVSIPPATSYLSEASASTMFALKGAINTFAADQTFATSVIVSGVAVFTSGARVQKPLTSPPTFELYTTQNAAASTTAGALIFASQDLVGTKVNVGGLRSYIESPAAASVQARLEFLVKSSTTALDPGMTLQQGLYMKNATGGDKGPGTVNATGLFVNGVSVLTSATGIVSVSSAGTGGTNLFSGISNNELLLNQIAHRHEVYLNGALFNTTGVFPGAGTTLQRAFTIPSLAGGVITFVSYQYYQASDSGGN